MWARDAHATGEELAGALLPKLTRQIARVTRPLLFRNTVGLGLVAFLPYMTEVLASALHAHHGERAATFFYGMPFALFGLSVVATWTYRAATDSSSP